MTRLVYGFPASPMLIRNVTEIHEAAGGGVIWDLTLTRNGKAKGFFDSDLEPADLFGEHKYCSISDLLKADYPNWEEARRSIKHRANELKPWMDVIDLSPKPALLMDWASDPIESMRGVLGQLLMEHGFIYYEWRKRPLKERRTPQANLFSA